MSELPERIELESAGRRSALVLRKDLSTDGAPVYSREPGGGLAVATGRVWIRFDDGVNVLDREADLERVGFRIDSAPKYAPNAAFVAAQDPAFALSHLEALRALAGVVLVEPQMLSRAASR